MKVDFSWDPLRSFAIIWKHGFNKMAIKVIKFACDSLQSYGNDPFLHGIYLICTDALKQGRWNKSMKPAFKNFLLKGVNQFTC